MITTCSITKGSALAAYDYNARKFFKGQADILEVANCPEGSALVNLKMEIKEREAARRFRSDVKNLGFHFTLNPGPDDSITDDGCRELIHNILYEIGLNEQPYAIFKHYDIEREHFHIVGTRIKRDKGIVKDSYWKLKVKSLLETNEQKYGYRYGGVSLDRMSNLSPARLTPGQTDMLEQMRVNFDEALRYNFETMQQFQAIMATMGIGVCERLQRASKKKKVLVFYGIDEDGNTVTRHFSAGKEFKKTAWARLQNTLHENSARHIQQTTPLIRRDNVIVSVGYMLKEASSMTHLNNMLAPYGIRVVRTADNSNFTAVSMTRDVVPDKYFNAEDSEKILRLPEHGAGEKNEPSKNLIKKMKAGLAYLNGRTTVKQRQKKKLRNG